jgi:hypothetical protein
VKFDFQKAHPEYRPLLQARFTGLVEKYPCAALRRVYVGLPRREDDQSMGYYDQDKDEVWLNSFWFSKSPSVLQQAAKNPPLFHGAMSAEPEHLAAHEFGHALEYGLGFEELDPRAQEIWREATRSPESACAQYGLTNATEHFAELFACCELGFATEEQRAQLRYVMEG